MAINAPIVIFTYRRKINVLINSLLKNKEAINSELFIFSDGFKSNYDKNDVLIVRKTLKEIKGFKSVKIIESNINKGLARSIIEGVDLVIKKLKRVIVLEDDLKVSPYFISYMNSCLEHYCDNKKIWSISGYGPPLKNIKDYKEDVYLSLRSSSSSSFSKVMFRTNSQPLLLFRTGFISRSPRNHAKPFDVQKYSYCWSFIKIYSLIYNMTPPPGP